RSLSCVKRRRTQANSRLMECLATRRLTRAITQDHTRPLLTRTTECFLRAKGQKWESSPFLPPARTHGLGSPRAAELIAGRASRYGVRWPSHGLRAVPPSPPAAFPCVAATACPRLRRPALLPARCSSGGVVGSAVRFLRPRPRDRTRQPKTKEPVPAAHMS